MKMQVQTIFDVPLLALPTTASRYLSAYAGFQAIPLNCDVIVLGSFVKDPLLYVSIVPLPPTM